MSDRHSRLRSIGARVALWYAGAATLTLAMLFVAGYVLLERHLLRGLDLLNSSEFQQIAARLGPDYHTLSEPFVEMRIRETTELASALFYIEIHRPGSGAIFRSTNLKGRKLPDVPGQERFSVEDDDLGIVRAAEFRLGPLEVLVGTPQQQVSEALKTYVEVCLGLLAVMLLASLLIGALLARLVLAPLRLIRDTADRIRSDNLGERIPVAATRDEIADLARLLNQMFDRLERSFTQVRRFTAEASHELRTPLSLIRLHAERMLNDAALPAAHRDAIGEQLEEVSRLNRVIEDLLFLARADANAVPIQRQLQPPEPFLQGFGQDAAALVEHHGLHFAWQHDGAGQVGFDARWIRQVLLNLVVNAVHASPPGTTVRLESRLDDAAWRLAVEDEGPGLDADQRERVFERFMRYAPPGQKDGGSGLGLAICRSIVELHGGRIRALPRAQGPGLRMELHIPL